MAVTVETASVLRQWRQRDQDSVILVWRPRGAPRGGGDETVAAAEAAVATANSALAAVSTSLPASVYGWAPWLGPRGPVMYVKPADSGELLEAWMGAAAEALSSHGWEGRIAAERTESPLIISEPSPVLTAVMCFDGWGTDGRGRAVSPWVTDQALSARLAHWAVGWCALSESSLYLSQGPGRFLMAPAAAREGLRRRPDGSHVLWSPVPDQARSVTFTSSGRLLVQLRDTAAGWQDLLNYLRDVLLAFAGSCSLSLVRYSWSNGYDLGDVINGWPPQLPRSPALDRPLGYYTFHRHLDAERVPDASGLQLLTDGHLARAHDLSRWQITTVAPGRHLVEAPDPSRWFSDTRPDPEELALARREFGDMILLVQPPVPG